jgi:hypothetical protein
MTLNLCKLTGSRDIDNGVIILATTKKMFTEDFAVLWALQLAKSHHFQSCIIEGDAKSYK